jgi:DNA-binding cell septation regulator SpoVG
MEVTDVRVRLVKDANDRLKAVCSATLDGEFVVRDVKVVEGTHGLFVAMPSRKLTAACPKCRTQNHLRARHCNECGVKLPHPRIPADADGREKVHRDIAHPITAPFRQTIQEHVLDAYRDACEQDEPVSPPDVETGVATDAEENGSEYDSIIADLRGGRNSADARGGDKDRSTGPGVSDDAADRSRRRRRRRGPREPRPEPASVAGDRDASHTGVTAPDFGQPETAEQGELTREASPPASTEEMQRDAMAAPMVSPDESPADSISASEPAADVPQSDEADEETTGFGEGLL